MPDLHDILIGLIVAFLILGAIGWWKTRRDPSWLYVDAADNEALAAAETDADNRRAAWLVGDEWQAICVAREHLHRDIEAAHGLRGSRRCRDE